MCAGIEGLRTTEESRDGTRRVQVGGHPAIGDGRIRRVAAPVSQQLWQQVGMGADGRARPRTRRDRLIDLDPSEAEMHTRCGDVAAIAAIAGCPGRRIDCPAACRSTAINAASSVRT